MIAAGDNMQQLKKPLNPVNEEVKEMKSVDEETNKEGNENNNDDEEYSDDNEDGLGPELQDINDLKTPTSENVDVQQKLKAAVAEDNNQSFRASDADASKNAAAAAG